ncbi:beta-lactamase family protein [Nocardia vinacea]|uniref:Beta-lactamase family protein n=1 Tax=Nocardia vinacea TaxID=96468 RepID=A0ABZ1Z0Q2_9NOCA|nr:serine hydrolase domain-containing protein [Nocardia vinacea]
MAEVALDRFVAEMAAKFEVPGAAVGVWVDGREVFAAHGVTSIESPVPVDRDTMFVLGSVSKTFTTTALMRLVAEGKVDLAAPVRRYVPELELADDAVAAEMTDERGRIVGAEMAGRMFNRVSTTA